MSWKKKLFFCIFTLTLLLVAVEGVARLIWFKLEQKVMSQVHELGKKQLERENVQFPNNAVVFMKQADPVYGYSLRPNFSDHGLYVNKDGFAQRDVVPVARKNGIKRIAALGESTTHGSSVDSANYPLFLRNCLRENAVGYKDAEMLNAGVAGWISDQVALRAEHQIRNYNPDLVVLYVGWNDFQGYDPLAETTAAGSFFDSNYGANKFLDSSFGKQFKSIELATALYQKWFNSQRETTGTVAEKSKKSGELRDAKDNYKFYFASLDRIVHAFRTKNPATRIAICTLVGRWPYCDMTDHPLAGRTWWMKLHNLSAKEADFYLQRFNSTIAEYARENNLVLLDLYSEFQPLDRSKLQIDFCHFTATGYELLGECIYEKLRQANLLEGKASPRLLALQNEFSMKENRLLCTSGTSK